MGTKTRETERSVKKGCSQYRHFCGYIFVVTRRMELKGRN
jgi:hypothetical protein